MAKVSFIGSGNTATTLGKALKKAGHEIVQVWSREERNAEKLAELLNCAYTSALTEINNEADIYLITVKDDAIEEVVKKLNLKDKIIAHTSGIRSKDLLRSAGGKYGVFYPNVSMIKGNDIDLSNVLIMIEGSDQTTISALRSLADSITGNAKIVQEKQRQSLHVAAVFANNFTNHMYVIAENILLSDGLQFNDIRPMIAAHMSSLMQQSPSLLQTGPGVRNDQTAIDSHIQIIESHKDLQEIYMMMTRSIQEWKENKYE